jgi:hypothetical protein
MTLRKLLLIFQNKFLNLKRWIKVSALENQEKEVMWEYLVKTNKREFCRHKWKQLLIVSK